MRLQVLVPLHVYPDGNSLNLVAHAAAVGRHLGADVHAMVVDVTFPQVTSLLGGVVMDVGGLVSGVLAQCRARGEALKRAMEDELGRLGVALRTTETDGMMGHIDDAGLAQARCHDLTLIGINTTDTSSQVTAERVIFGSGRPALLVPEDEGPSAFRHVLIAWDGSRVAARTVADARDVLRLAEVVTIVSVTDDKPLPYGAPESLLAEYLSHHDVQALTAQVRRNGRPIAEALQDHARDIGADVIVMGAFGHSRVRDFVLGSATGGVLRDLRLPVLLSH